MRKAAGVASYIHFLGAMLVVGSMAMGCAALLGGEAGILDERVDVPDGQTADEALADAPTIDAPCSADLTRDSLNCGGCGRDCRGGNCVDSQCTPVTIAANLPGPYYLAQDATHLYVSSVTTGHVHRVAKAGGSAPELVIDVPTGRSFAVAVDDTYVYASDLSRNVVVRAPKTGGGPVDELVTNTNVVDIVVDNGTVFMARYESPDGGPGAVERMLPDGGGRTTVVGDLPKCEGLAFSADKMFVGVFGTLHVYSRDGGSPTIVPNAPVRRLVYVDGFPYWVAFFGTRAFRLSAVGVVEPLVNGPAEIGEGSLAVDDRNVYWAIGSAEGKDVYVADKDPASITPPRLLLTVGRPFGILVDETSVYVADIDGKILRVTK